MPSVLFDAVVVPDGEEAAERLALLGQALEFIKDQYRHCKPILMLGAGREGGGGRRRPRRARADWALATDVKASSRPSAGTATGTAPPIPRRRSNTCS